MDIEILDINNTPILMAYGLEDPEHHFQFVLKDFIPNAVSWRAYLPPTPTPEELLAGIRARRDKLLAESDWTQVTDSPLTPVAKESWRVYRQALRDITINVDLLNPAWPKL